MHYGGLKRLQPEFVPSFGDFLSFRVAGAQQVYLRLLKQGVIVPISGYGMPEYLRVTVGLESGILASWLR
jgi:histidinol-phosphate aminotransferase